MGDRRFGSLAVALAAAACALAATRAARARDEGILELHAKIALEEDGSARVEDTILVWVAGVKIKHGISWDVVTRYEGGRGEAYAADPAALEVTRDGQPEAFSLEELHYGERLHIGDPELSLEPGTHVYVVSYRTYGQVGFFDGHDELCFAAKGAGTEFPITQSSVVLELPQKAAHRLESLDGWVTDERGVKAPPTRFSGERRGDSAVLTVTRPLAADEGLTTLATFPKGVVREPPWLRRLLHEAGARRSLVVASTALLLQAPPLLVALGLAGQRRPNARYLAPGLVFSFAAVLALAAGARGHGAFAVALGLASLLLLGAIVVMSWSFGCARFWRSAVEHRSGIKQAIVSSLLVLPALAAEIAGLWAFAARTSSAAAVLLVATAAIDFTLVRRRSSALWARSPRRGKPAPDDPASALRQSPGRARLP